MQVPLLRATLAAVAILVLAIPGQAQITRLVVEHTETIGPDGYEKLTGHAYGEVDPKLPLNAIITDLEFAPRNARGMVEYVATFTIIKPVDMADAGGVLLYFVPNRGRINLTDGGFIADARKQGHVLVASGWQGDLVRLGPYEVLAAIGKGGMGEVWRARDAKLGREVTIKTLPEEFSADPDRRVRFEREAKVLAPRQQQE